MEMKTIDCRLTVCQLTPEAEIDLRGDFYFIAKTDEEISLVCPEEAVPANPVKREDGWRGFRIQGVLDFSMIGVLSKLSGILAGEKIGIFAVSTYNTDYILVKRREFRQGIESSKESGI